MLSKNHTKIIEKSDIMLTFYKLLSLTYRRQLDFHIFYIQSSAICYFDENIF